VTSTSATSMQTLANTNTIAEADLIIVADAANAVSFTRAAEESYTGRMDYVSLIATNNFFVAVQGTLNTAAKSVNGRIWGFRAKMDAAGFAALVQSEVLSS